MKKFFRKFLETIKNKWLIKGTTTVILVAIVIACYIALNWGVKQLNIEDLDFTTKNLYSLSEETKKRLNDLDREITIQLVNMSDYTYAIEYANKYKNASDKVTVEEIADLSARTDLQTKYNVTSNDYFIVVKSGEEEKALYESDLVTYDYTTGKQINVIEEAITNAIVELTIEDKPQIYVLEGKAYTDPEQSLGIIANELIDEANEIDLLDILTKGNIPEDCDCLIITTLKQDLSDLERDKILEYINNGGKILMLTSQNIIEVDTPNFDQVLAQYGIKLGYGSILEQDSSKMLYDTPNMILTDVNASFMDRLGMSLKMFIVNPGKIEFEDETKLEELGVTYEKIATTSEKSFVRTNFNLQSNSRTNEDSEEGSNIVAAHITKTISDDKSSQLIIYSNETFASTSQIIIGYQSIYAVNLYNNQDIVLNSVSHLTEREDTITIRKTDEAETYTVTDQEDVVIKTIIFVVPVLTMGIGLVVWVLRRRRV